MADEDTQRTVFFISDGTGITAETLGYTLLSQFQELSYRQETIPFVDNLIKAEKVVAQIDQLASEEACRPLVFATIVNSEIREIVGQANAKHFDLFKAFIPEMEKELDMSSGKLVGFSHGMKNLQSYNSRIEAVNFALSCDDGVGTQNYENADMILTGVSRCGKTPTSLYLALHFGLYIANYPFTEEDFPLGSLPELIKPYKDKLFGLTIRPPRLQAIRRERRANSRYASIEQCEHELNEVEKMYRREGIPFIDTTNHSIEEISARILSKKGLRRRSY